MEKGELNEIHALGASDVRLLPLDTGGVPMYRRDLAAGRAERAPSQESSALLRESCGSLGSHQSSPTTPGSEPARRASRGWQSALAGAQRRALGHKSGGGQLPPQKGSLHESSIDAGPLDGARPATPPPFLSRSTTTPPPRPGDRPPRVGCPTVAVTERRGARAAGDV